MRSLRVWKWVILIAVLTTLGVWWPRPPDRPTLRLTSPTPEPRDGIILVELRNDTNQTWYWRRGMHPDNALRAGQFCTLRAEPGSVCEVALSKPPGYWEKWRMSTARLLRWRSFIPNEESTELSIWVPPTFNVERQHHDTDMAFGGHMKLDFNGWEREPGPSAGTRPLQPAKSP